MWLSRGRQYVHRLAWQLLWPIDSFQLPFRESRNRFWSALPDTDSSKCVFGSLSDGVLAKPVWPAWQSVLHHSSAVKGERFDALCK